jgi:hypothetical protein
LYWAQDLDREEVFKRVVQHPKVGMGKKPPSDEEGSIVILDSDSEEEKVRICVHLKPM